MLRSTGRYQRPLALDCGTGAAAVRDQAMIETTAAAAAGGTSRAMWTQDKNASPINWLLLRQQHRHRPDDSGSNGGALDAERMLPPQERRPRRCHLLEDVPVEVREMILRECLPRTIAYRGGTAWCRGSMAVLRVCRQLYNEGTRVLFRESTLSLDVVYDCAFFAMTWLTPTPGEPARVLHVRRQRPFPECLARRSLPKLRRFEITVRHVDSYTGATKYGYGGGGLTDGLRDQVAFLCQVLRPLPVIDLLELSYQCQDAHHKAATQSVLDPFFTLHNVRHVKTSGHITEHTARELARRLPEQRWQRLEQEEREKGEGQGEHEDERQEELEGRLAPEQSRSPGMVQQAHIKEPFPSIIETNAPPTANDYRRVDGEN